MFATAEGECLFYRAEQIEVILVCNQTLCVLYFEVCCAFSTIIVVAVEECDEFLVPFCNENGIKLVNTLCMLGERTASSMICDINLFFFLALPAYSSFCFPGRF